MNLEYFFQNREIFTKDEFVGFIEKNLKGNPKNYFLILSYYIKKGRIMKIRNNLYSVIPLNADKNLFIPNSLLVAGKISEDAVLAYYSAMEYYGISYSLLNLRTFLTSKNIKPFFFRETKYKPVKFTTELVKKKKEKYLTKTVDIHGEYVKMTTLERTFVDMLDKPNYCGGIDEVWESLEMIEYLDLQDVLKYLLLLNNKTTNSKVGYYLEENRERFNVNDEYLKKLNDLKPKTVHYMDRGFRKNTKLIKKWNLAVPKNLFKEKMG